MMILLNLWFYTIPNQEIARVGYLPWIHARTKINMNSSFLKTPHAFCILILPESILRFILDQGSFRFWLRCPDIQPIFFPWCPFFIWTFSLFRRIIPRLCATLLPCSENEDEKNENSLLFGSLVRCKRFSLLLQSLIENRFLFWVEKSRNSLFQMASQKRIEAGKQARAMERE